MIELAINNKIISIPTQLDELLPDVVKAVAKVYFNQDILLVEKINYVLVNGLGLNNFLKKNSDYDFIAEQLIANGVYDKMIWLFDAPFLTHQFFGKVRYSFRNFYGPDSEFDNLIFIEWMIVDQLFNNWLTVKDKNSTEADELICKIVGCLYRVKKFGFSKHHQNYAGDLRLKFNEEWVDSVYLELGKKSPEWLKWVTMLWWYCCRVDLVDRYEYVFNNEEMNEDGGNPILLIQGLAGKVFGSFNEVKNHNVHDCLAFLDNSIKQNKQATENSGVTKY